MKIFKVMKNKKGFTLIELLAVIVILGVLMVIAIPAMTRTIDNSRKDAFMSNAKTVISSVRYSLLNEEYYQGTTLCSMPKANAAVVVDASPSKEFVEYDKGGKTSPWSKAMSSAQVVVVNEGTDASPKYVYYYWGKDTDNNGINKLVKEDTIKRSDVGKGTVTATASPIGTTTSFLASLLTGTTITSPTTTSVTVECTVNTRN